MNNNPPIIFLAFANEQEQGHAFLRGLNKEQRGLTRTLEAAQDDKKCQVITKFGATVDDIFDTFQKEQNQGRICIFHYAGHANSFQLLLESESGGNQSANASALIRFLSKQEGLRFVFLNGCSTQEQVKQLNEMGIPAIATSQSINDEVATDFAVRFYKGIAKDLSLEKSFEAAADYIDTFHGSGNVRDLYWEEAEDKEVDGLPWALHTLPDKDQLKGWSLKQERISGDWVNRVKQLVAQNKLKDALNLASQNLEGQDTHSEVLGFQQRLKKVARQERNGLLSFEQVGLEYARITHGLLELLGEEA